MIKRYTTALLLITAYFSAYSQRDTLRAPKLIVGIVVEQMRHDYLQRYWNKLDNYGFKRLVNNGTVYQNAHYNYLLTQSAPGYATLATGAQPSGHGIVSNRWYERLPQKMTSCIADEQMQTVGSNSNTGKVSPHYLNTTTFADELKLATMQQSIVYSIGMKDIGAVLTAGRRPDGAFWFDANDGMWVSSSFYMGRLPDWVVELNNRRMPDTYLNRQWNTLKLLSDYTESLPDNNPYEKGLGNDLFTFPYDMKTIQRARKDYSILAQTPWGNTFTNDLAIAALTRTDIGRDNITDYLQINYSTNGYVTDLFGITSVEIEDVYLRLDNEIARLLQVLDDYVGRGNYLIFLTSDQGAMHPAQYLIDMDLPGGEFRDAAALTLLQSYLRVLYGQGEWLEEYTEHQIYLNRNLIEDNRLSLNDVQDKVANFMVQFTGMAHAFAANALDKGTLGNFSQKAQNSFYQKRSGDVLLNLESGWVQVSGNAHHNSAYSYDSHVPLIWYGWNIEKRNISRRVDIADVAPTLSFISGAALPSAYSGIPLQELLSE